MCGLVGAKCRVCKVSRKDAGCLKRVKKGFEVERLTMDETTALFDHLLASVGGDMTKFMKIPSDRRFGMNRRQMGTGLLNSQLVITPLHGWLNILRQLEKCAYLLIACRMRKRFRKWSKGMRMSKFMKEVWKRAKYELQRRAKRAPINLFLDFPDFNHAGGSTDTGTPFLTYSGLANLW